MSLARLKLMAGTALKGRAMAYALEQAHQDAERRATVRTFQVPARSGIGFSGTFSSLEFYPPRETPVRVTVIQGAETEAEIRDRAWKKIWAYHSGLPDQKPRRHR